jgi:hypothetical protein
MKKSTCLLTTFASGLLALSASAMQPQGGGTTTYRLADGTPRGAWHAQYWNNTNWTGTAAWEQSQERIRFDWGTTRPIIGVNSEQLIPGTTTAVKNFPTDNFSIRFESRLIARFAESYTFKLTSDGGASLQLRPVGSSTWTTLIPASAKISGSKEETGTFNMATGTTYEARINYYDTTGNSRCELRWSAPSFPEEVLDFAAVSATKDYNPLMWADAAAFGKDDAPSADFGNPDANGWPTTNSFSMNLSNNYPGKKGWHRVTFRGKAQVKGGVRAKVGTTLYSGNTVPKGDGYDAATGITEVWLLWINGNISFSSAERNDGTPGITDIQVMRPRFEDTNTNATENVSIPHPRGEIIHQATRDAFLPFAMVRFQKTGLNDIEKWADRTPPTYAKIQGKVFKSDYVYEKLFLMANEMGRDLHLCFSGSCDETFMRNLALIAKYGSDANGTPYTNDVANPVWPPLNSNLRLYTEHGNEMGWSAIQPTRWQTDYKNLRQGSYSTFPGGTANATATWAVVNFDGKATNTAASGLFRYHAYRSLRMGENLRSVFGDAAMGEVIRPMLFGQYEVHYLNSMLQFVDDYYNNGVGNNVANPHPPKYFFWGGGPASYYGPLNMWAEMRSNGSGGYENLAPTNEATARKWLPNRSFEEYNLADGTLIEATAANNANKGWTFSGNAGVINFKSSRNVAAVSLTNTSTTTSATTNGYGYRFTVGSSDLYVYEFGRRVLSGNAGKHRITILQADGSIVIPDFNGLRSNAEVDTKNVATDSTLFGPGRYQNWPVTAAAHVGVYRLEAGKSYIVFSEEGGADTFYGAGTSVTPGTGIASIDGPVVVQATSVTGGKAIASSNITFTANAGKGYAAPTFRYTTQTRDLPSVSGTQAILAPDPSVDPVTADPNLVENGPPAPSPISSRQGEHMVFIAGTGAIESTFTVAAGEASEYMLVVTGCNGFFGDNPLNMYINGEKVWDKELLGAERKPKFGVYDYGSRYSAVLQPGTYTVRIEGTSTNVNAVAYINSVQIGSLAAYFGDSTAVNLLGSGTATGEVATEDADGAPFVRRCELVTMMALNWGLAPYVYEGGTNPGGDWNGQNVFYTLQSKYEHPMGKVADNQWAGIWHDFGGFNDMYYYESFPTEDLEDPSGVQTYIASFERGATWQLEPTKGHLVKSDGSIKTLTAALPHAEGRPLSDYRGYYNPSREDTTTYNTDPTITANLPALSNNSKPNQWKSWRILVQSSANYNVTVSTTTGGTVRVSIDDGDAVASGTSGSNRSGTVFLTKGVHTVKAKAVSGEFDVTGIQLQVSNGTVLTPPSDLSATLVSTNQINLSWSDNSSNETKFRIERKVGTGSFAHLATVNSNVTSYSNSGLSAGTYTYRVAASNATGLSAWSEEVSATIQSNVTVTVPSAPSNLAAAAVATNQINLSWTDNANNETGFRLERKTGSGSFALVTTLGSNVTSYSNSGLNSGTAYTYRIAATNSAGLSTWSAEASATTQTPSTGTVSGAWIEVGGVVVMEAENAEVVANGDTINWAAQTTNGVICMDAGYRAAANAVWTNATELKFTVNIATAGSYNIRIRRRAIDGYADSAYLGLNGTQIGTSQFSGTSTGFTWTTTSVSLGTLTAGDHVIQIRRREAGMQIDRVMLATNNASFPASTAVGPAESERSGGTTVTVPAAPSNLSASSSATNQINLSWSDNADNETGFRLERKTGTGSFALVTTLGSNVTSYSNSGLASGTAYTYRIAATNSAGLSTWSAEASATTQTAPATNTTALVEEHFTDLNGTGSTGVSSWPKGSITNGLSYSGLASAGGALTAASTYGNSATFDGTGCADSTFWFSVLVKNTVDQDRLLFFGTGSSTSGAGVDFTASGARADISGTVGTAVTITPANVNLIVGKMVLSSTGNETVTIWVNPTDFTSEAAMTNSAAGSSTVTAAGTMTCSTSSKVYARMQGTATVFDEIRLGTALGSVVPVSGGLVGDYALAENTVTGTITGGSMANTYNSENSYEVLQEAVSGSTSALEHVWTLNVTGGTQLTFYVEAHHTTNSEGDDFIFAYSTNGTNYTDMVTVSKTADNNSLQWYSLPGNLSGTVYVRAKDADRTSNRTGLDSLSVDHLFITSE